MNKLSLLSTVEVTKESVHCSVEEEIVILSLKDGVYYGLNPVGAFIWNLIQKPKTIEEIHNAVLLEFDVDEEECMEDLNELMGELLKKSLIEVKNDDDP
jgi:hypothetical protein